MVISCRTIVFHAYMERNDQDSLEDKWSTTRPGVSSSSVSAESPFMGASLTFMVKQDENQQSLICIFNKSVVAVCFSSLVSKKYTNKGNIFRPYCCVARVVT